MEKRAKEGRKRRTGRSQIKRETIQEKKRQERDKKEYGAI